MRAAELLYGRSPATRAPAPPRGKNVDLRIAQFEAFRDHVRALTIARAVVAAKIANAAAVLKLYRRHADGLPADFNQELSRYGRGYALQVSQDYGRFKAAFDAGKL